MAGALGLTPSSLQREMASLTEAGLLRREVDGNRVYYQADPTFPIMSELQSIFAKTTGLADQVRAALDPFVSQIDFAFIYGSVARNERTASSDVDVMVIGAVRLSDFSLPFRELERTLQVPVNTTLFSLTEFMRKLEQGSHFLETVMQGQKIFLKGNENELANAVSAAVGKIARHE
ncbi:MAG: nucleotidyltransferase domain-containing protein [Capsulimonas sp.]|uniref:nucleotidyltransferase domain-containing protein n=1 Tax=Capsulimonas sp. TaxID=2494211 RepID=UPI003265BAE9